MVSLAAGLPEAARGGAHVRVRPIRRNSRKSKPKKSKPKAVFQPQYNYNYYQTYYEPQYQSPYDPTGHGDPHFSYFQGKLLIVCLLKKPTVCLDDEMSSLNHLKLILSPGRWRMLGCCSTTSTTTTTTIDFLKTHTLPRHLLQPFYALIKGGGNSFYFLVLYTVHVLVPWDSYHCILV